MSRQLSLTVEQSIFSIWLICVEGDRGNYNWTTSGWHQGWWQRLSCSWRFQQSCRRTWILSLCQLLRYQSSENTRHGRKYPKKHRWGNNTAQ